MDGSQSTATQLDSQTLNSGAQGSERPPAARLFEGISFFVEPTRDPFFAERLKERIRDAGGIVHNAPAHPAVTIVIVFPRYDAPTNLVLNLTPPRLTLSQLRHSGRWDMYSLVWHYARMIVDGQTRPERHITTPTGYKCTRVFSAEWVDVVIQHGQCDIKKGKYDFLHREILLQSGGTPAYQPRADPRPRPPSPQPSRQDHRSSAVANPHSLAERIGGAGVPPGDLRPAYNPRSLVNPPALSERLAAPSGRPTEPRRAYNPREPAVVERSTGSNIPLRERLSSNQAPHQAPQQRCDGAPESLDSSTGARRSFPAESPSTPSKRPRLDPPTGPKSSREDTESTPRPPAQRDAEGALAPLSPEKIPKVEVKLEPFDTWIVCADVPVPKGNFEWRKVTIGRSAKASTTIKATEPAGANVSERQTANNSEARPSPRATPDNYRMSTPVSNESDTRPSIAPSSPEVPLADIRRRTITPLSAKQTSAPPATASHASAPAPQPAATRTESAAPPTPVTAGMGASALGLRNVSVPPVAAPNADLTRTRTHAIKGALVGAYGLRNTFCTDYCGRGSMILNPFITLNGGLVTTATRATFILLPLDPSQVAENADDRAIIEAIDEAQAVLSDRYVADSIAAGGILPIEEYKIRLDP